MKRLWRSIGDSIRVFYLNIADDRTLIIQAHPFRPDETRADMDCIDGIEVFNMHPGHHSRVDLAAKYAYDNGARNIVGGSDTHKESDAGFIAMLSKTLPQDSFELADILRSGDYLFETEGNIVVPYTFKDKL